MSFLLTLSTSDIGIRERPQWGFVTLNGNLAVNLKTTYPPLLNCRGEFTFLNAKLSHSHGLCTHQKLSFLEINCFWETMNYFPHVETPDK